MNTVATAGIDTTHGISMHTCRHVSHAMRALI
jgi:hypothetical protein